MYKTVELVKEGRLARLTLNRPESMNAMDDVMMKELADVFESLKSDVTVQVLIIQGAGRTFSAGGDIKKMIDPNNPLDIGKVMVCVSRLAKALYTLPQITIAAVHGAAAGLGFSLVLGCDYIIAEENSKLAMNFIGIGLVPDGGGHFFLKERVGVPQAKQLIWSGKVMNGHEALAKGLIDGVVADGQSVVHAEAYATKLLAAPITSMIASKNILHEQKKAELENVLKMENEAQVAMRKTGDHLEGIQAFVQKRKPEFKGN
ncbi:enoyl-CoA hydratase [Sporosarcina limicola]|uniref:Enoyl-CoA hydratase/carnithine racemase n=1 Tax=Sporosarcina limicola TaxID=34101 RepID=A0A927MPD2_9BACL|nr:enoyl-CoA hydratase [Sporosarcina limicola]MBE1554921.1 enoyl-CoA hydratase/carnithine racemase [Sporosarcina limicola]